MCFFMNHPVEVSLFLLPTTFVYNFPLSPMLLVVNANA